MEEDYPSMPKPRYKVEISSPISIARNSYILAGLFELEKQGLVSLTIRPDLNWRIGRIIANENEHYEELDTIYGSASRYRVQDNSLNKQASFAFDPADRADTFPLRYILSSDRLYKTNVSYEYVDRLDKSLRRKVSPAGIRMNVRSSHEHDLLRLHTSYLAYQLFGEFKNQRSRFGGKLSPRLLIARCRKVVRWRSNYLAIRLIKAYEYDIEDQLNTHVLFQPRCFGDIGPADHNLINEERAELLRALRTHLQEGFQGGFVPDHIARTRYADVITDQPTSPAEYFRLVRKAAVVIYTRGVEHALGRKLGEYLAASKCVVAQRPERSFRRPLQDGKEIFFFDTVEECIEICRYLIGNPSLARAVGSNAKKYYQAEVSPGENVLKLLKNAF